MQTNQLFNRLLYLFWLGLILSFNGCSDSNDNDSYNSCQSFLECQNETFWKIDNSTDYIKFVNDGSTFIALVYFEGSCYYADPLAHEYTNPIIEIIENTKSKLRIGFNDNEYNDIYTFTLNGETLNFSRQHFGISSTHLLSKTSIFASSSPCE